MAEPQFPLFDAIGRSEPRKHSDRGMLLRLGAYLVQVAAIGTTLWLSSRPTAWSGNHWLLVGGCGLIAVGSGFVLIWPLARASADAVSRLVERVMPRTRLALWVAPPTPEVLPPRADARPGARHLRLVWDRTRAERAEREER